MCQSEGREGSRSVKKSEGREEGEEAEENMSEERR